MSLPFFSVYHTRICALSPAIRPTTQQFISPLLSCACDDGIRRSLGKCLATVCPAGASNRFNCAGRRGRAALVPRSQAKLALRRKSVLLSSCWAVGIGGWLRLMLMSWGGGFLPALACFLLPLRPALARLAVDIPGVSNDDGRAA